MTTQCSSCKSVLYKTQYCKVCNTLHVPRLSINTLQGMIITILRKDGNFRKGDQIFLNLHQGYLRVMVFNDGKKRFFVMRITTSKLIKKSIFDN